MIAFLWQKKYFWVVQRYISIKKKKRLDKQKNIFFYLKGIKIKRQKNKNFIGVFFLWKVRMLFHQLK